MICFNQSECFISEKSCYSTLKFVNDIGSQESLMIYLKWQSNIILYIVTAPKWLETPKQNIYDQTGVILRPK